MNKQIEAYCNGIFRSYKTFRSSGEVVQHTLEDFQEWRFNDAHLLTISQYRKHRQQVVLETDQWSITFHNRRHYLDVPGYAIRYELITLNHTGLVIEEPTRGEKIFFARLPAWERLMRERLPVL